MGISMNELTENIEKSSDDEDDDFKVIVLTICCS